MNVMFSYFRICVICNFMAYAIVNKVHRYTHSLNWNRSSRYKSSLNCDRLAVNARGYLALRCFCQMQCMVRNVKRCTNPSTLFTCICIDQPVTICNCLICIHAADSETTVELWKPSFSPYFVYLVLGSQL